MIGTVEMAIEDVEVIKGNMSYAEAVKQKPQPKQKKSTQTEINNVQLKSVKADNSIKPLETIQVLLSVPSGKQVEAAALPDTGANINVMPESLAKQFFKSIRVPAIIKEPKCANNTGMKILGRISTDLIYKEVLLTDVEWQVSSVETHPWKTTPEAARVDLRKLPFRQQNGSGQATQQGRSQKNPGEPA